MKTIKIESIGQEPILLNVPEGAKVSIEDGLTIVEPENYVPKVGDCVKVDFGISLGLAHLSKIEKGRNYYFAMVDSNNSVSVNDWYDSNWDCTKITPDELQAEFNKLGYEYDFETHTAKKMRWKPKDGERYWVVDIVCEVFYSTWWNDHADINRYNVGNCFKTEAEAQKFKDYILKYNPE